MKKEESIYCGKCSDLAFLADELKKAWLRSGETVETVKLPISVAKEILWQVIGTGILYGQQASREEHSFREDMGSTKVCHVYLRLAMKMQRLIKEWENNDMSDSFFLKLDEEEAAFFNPIHERVEKKNAV